jgi:C-terminal processing protease CtpA/Prc
MRDVFKDSPISKTNIQAGDILTKINDASIDNYGLINSSFTSGDKVAYTGVFDDIEMGDKVKVEYYHSGKLCKKSFIYEKYELPLKYIYSRFETIEYEILGGIVFMDFYINHLSLIEDDKLPVTLLKYYNSDNRLKSKIIVSYIYPNTDISNLDVIEEGDFITSINNKPVTCIKDFRQQIRKVIKNKHGKFIKINTEDNKVVVLNLKDTLDKEKNISETFKFELTKSYHDLHKLK